MPITEIPGSCVRHRYITDECRQNKGDDDATMEAIEDVKQAVIQALEGWKQGNSVRIHIVVTVQRP